MTSNKKVSTSCAQNIEQCNIDNGTREQYSSGSNDYVGGISNNNTDKNIISDDELFKDPPPKEDCPICMQPMPYASGLCGVNISYMSCCGMIMCNGCVFAAQDEMKKGNMKSGVHSVEFLILVREMRY